MRIRTAWLYRDYRGLGGTEYLATNILLLLSKQVEKLLLITKYPPNPAWLDQLIPHSGDKFEMLVLEESFENFEVVDKYLSDHQIESLVIMPLEDEGFGVLSFLNKKYKFLGLEPCDLSHKCWWLPSGLGEKLKLLDHLFVLNESSAQNSRRQYAYQNQVSILPNSLINEPDTEDTQLPRNPNSIGCISRLSAEKGIEYLLAAVKFCTDEIKGISLHLYGDGEDLSRLTNLAMMLDIGDKCHFHGSFHPFEGIDQIIKRHEVFVLPSLFEGTPVSNLEILFREKALISSKTAGASYLFGDADEWLYDPGDVHRLSFLIKELLNDPEKKNAYLKDHLNDIKRRFNREQTLQALLSAYARIHE